MTARAGGHAGITVFTVSAALFADSLLYSAVVPVLPLYAREHGASTTAIGLLFASYAAALLAMTPLAALISETVGHRRMLVAGCAAVTAATLLFATAESYGELLAGRSLQGAAAAVVWTSGVALVADRVEVERQGTMMGFLMAAVSTGLLLGPPVGGVLTDALGYRTAFLLLAGAAAVCAVLQPLLLPTGSSIRSGTTFRALTTTRFLSTMLAVAMAAGCLALLEPLVPLDLHSRLGAGSREIGLVFGIATLAHLAAAPAVGALADRCARMSLIAWGLMAMGAIVPLLTIPGSLTTTVIVLALFAVAYSFVLVPTLPEIAEQSRAAGGGYAAAYASFNVAFAIGMMTGPASGGALASALSVDFVLILTSALLLGAGVLTRLLHPASPRPIQNGATPCPVPSLPSAPCD